MDPNSRAMKILMMSRKMAANVSRQKTQLTKEFCHDYERFEKENDSSINDISMDDLLPDASLNLADISIDFGTPNNGTYFENLPLSDTAINTMVEEVDRPVYAELVPCQNHYQPDGDRNHEMVSTPSQDQPDGDCNHEMVSTPSQHQPVVSTPSQHQPVVSTPSQHQPVVSTPSQHQPDGDCNHEMVSTPSQHQPVVSTPSQHQPVVSTPSQHQPVVSTPSQHQPDGDCNHEMVSTPNQRDNAQDGITTITMESKNLGKGIMKRKRELGEIYTGRKFDKESKTYTPVEKIAKILGDRCKCKAKYYHCTDISDTKREEIHSYIWRLTWDEKRVFVKTSVDSLKVKERKANPDDSRRQSSLQYSLRGDGGNRVRVCKQMYQATTGLTQWFILSCMKTNDDPPEKIAVRSSSTPSETLSHLRQFLESLPKMPSHYCRKETSKLYLEPVFKSYADLYQEYTNNCLRNSNTPMSRATFMKEVSAKNVSIFHPRKDRCDLCSAHEAGNLDEEEYLRHRQKKEQAQQEKEKDKLAATTACNAGIKTKVIAVDVQRVLLAPCLHASALYYKTKLQVHNYSVFDLTTKDALCYLWHEAEGAMTSNEFASCLFNYLTENLEFDKFIIFSDGCTYQNRNHTLASSLRYFCKKYKKTVEQKFLERGHTQMEVDSVHATIKRRLKGADIYTPSDYVRIIKEARKTPQPYRVNYVDHPFFSNFKDFGTLKSIKPGKKASDPNVTDIKALHYNPDGSIEFKTDFANEWSSLPLPRNDMIPEQDPKHLYTSKLNIKQTKYDHLQSMKPVLVKDAHAFYDALPH